MNSFSDMLMEASQSMTDLPRGIWSVLFDLDVRIIDMKRTRTVRYPDDRFISINVFSEADYCCPVEIGIGLGQADGRVFFCYDSSGPILDEFVRTENEAAFVKEAIRHHLAADVVEEKTFVKGKLIKVKHTYTYPVDSESLTYPFVTILKFSFPWNKKVVERRSYNPWPLCEQGKLQRERGASASSGA